MDWSKDGAERSTRLQTLAENGGDVWRYALDCLTTKPSDTVPVLNSQELRGNADAGGCHIVCMMQSAAAACRGAKAYGTKDG